jgi:hypothetical protein
MCKSVLFDDAMMPALYTRTKRNLVSPRLRVQKPGFARRRAYMEREVEVVSEAAANSANLYEFGPIRSGSVQISLPRLV